MATVDTQSTRESRFEFKPIPLEFPPKELRESFEKWGLLKHCSLCKFSFDEKFELADLQGFLLDLFNSEAMSQFKVSIGGSYSEELKSFTGGDVSFVKSSLLSTKVMNMAFFDALIEAGVVSADSGHIKRCMEDEYDGLRVGDHLRELLVSDDSEYALTFDEDQRSEFIYHLFRRMAIGGSMNQFEDTWTPYLEATKALYKLLLTVVKEEGQIRVASLPLEIHAVEGAELFPTESPYNFAYAVIDPAKKQVFLFYFAFLAWW